MLLIVVPAHRAVAWHSETAHFAVVRNASAEAADEAAPALAPQASSRLLTHDDYNEPDLRPICTSL